MILFLYIAIIYNSTYIIYVIHVLARWSDGSQLSLRKNYLYKLYLNFAFGRHINGPLRRLFIMPGNAVSGVLRLVLIMNYNFFHVLVQSKE